MLADDVDIILSAAKDIVQGLGHTARTPPNSPPPTHARREPARGTAPAATRAPAPPPSQVTHTASDGEQVPRPLPSSPARAASSRAPRARQVLRILTKHADDIDVAFIDVRLPKLFGDAAVAQYDAPPNLHGAAPRLPSWRVSLPGTARGSARTARTGGRCESTRRRAT